jgi:hypothetical protein
MKPVVRYTQVNTSLIHFLFTIVFKKKKKKPYCHCFPTLFYNMPLGKSKKTREHCKWTEYTSFSCTLPMWINWARNINTVRKTQKLYDSTVENAVTTIPLCLINRIWHKIKTASKSFKNGTNKTKYHWWRN